MITLDCLGASQEVGRSAFLLKTDKSFMLDYGVKLFGGNRKEGKPEYPLPLSYEERIDAILLSHAHLDHSGHIPFLYKNYRPQWFCNASTKEISEVLMLDSMKIMGDDLPWGVSNMERALRAWSDVEWGVPFEFGENRITYSDAGHILGSSIIEVEHKGKKLVYTGDFKSGESRMHKGAKPVKDADYLMIDCTYAMKEHPDRKKTEERLMDEIYDTLEDDGTVLLPAFAVGRTQELISIIRSHDNDIPVFVDGMGKGVAGIYLNHKDQISDGKGFSKHLKSVQLVEGPQHKREATSEPSVIVTTAGMMEGGPVMNYLMNLRPGSKIIFTGYNVEGTNGWRLINEGSVIHNDYEMEVDFPVEYFDFSAHAGKNDVMDFIKSANPDKLVLIHGDHNPEFAESLRADGWDAVAPKAGDRIVLEG
ncbi:MAG: MBL fold metallo-hydrolase [Candidatus Bilamarchaeaceae archaeon]